MRQLVKMLTIAAFSFGMMFGVVSRADHKVSNVYKPRFEPTGSVENTNTSSSPIMLYNNRDNYFEATLIDSSKNGYGMVAGNTYPLAIREEGFFAVYRQWAGEAGTSGQIGSAFSEDGVDWTTYQNLNPGMGIGRYPSALANEEYPYAFWNEYTGDGNPSYGGRPYYAYDEFGWDGGSFSDPYDVDPAWSADKDLWVGTVDYSYDADNDEHHFNACYNDWTRADRFCFTSEAYEDGFIVFSTEEKVINENDDFIGGDDEGTYMSNPVIDINEDGIGYVGVTAYFLGATDGVSHYANPHTVVFKGTENYGVDWGGDQGGSGYYFIPDNVYDHMFTSGAFDDNTEYDPCFVDDDGEPYYFDELFATYDFAMKVDSDGNPHIVVGLLPSSGDYIFPGFKDNGYYHFTIDKDDLLNPGAPQSATGWNYSKVIATDDMWPFEDEDGFDYWQNVFPSLAISTENEDIMYVAVSGPSAVDFITVDDAGTPDDECDDMGFRPTFNEDIFVVKTTDGGSTWWDPYNATNTKPDCWVAACSDIQYHNEEDCIAAGETWSLLGAEEVHCEDTEFCEDGETLNQPDEISAHAGNGATDEVMYIMYQSPDWCYGSTTGDMSAPNHRNRVYVGKVTIEGTVSTNPGNEVVASEFELKNAYPNPFNPTTSIEYTVANAGDVTITVYDMLGREVRTLASGHHNSATYSVVWNGLANTNSEVSSGVYFYKMTAGEFVKTNKIVFMK